MASFNKFDKFVEDLASGIHDFRSAGDTVKIYLTNQTPDAFTDAVKADLTEISAGNGYTSGGFDVQNSLSQTDGIANLEGVDVTITASGGTIGPFRYVILYNDSPTSPADPLIGWWDYGTSLTLQDGETFTTDFGPVILSIT